MSESILPGALHRETEFVRGLTGACGPNALAMGDCWANQHSAADTYSVYLDMRSRGLLANVNGASTIEQLRQEAVARGLPIPANGYRAYGEPWSDWRTFYSAHVGTHYILMETANGQALKDSISGLGENATNLHYHFIGVVGHHDGGWSAHAGASLPAGWWAVDGDSYATGDTLQFYSDEVMAAAQPCGALAFAAKVSMQMAWMKQADGSGKDSAGHVCGTGFMADIAAHGGADGMMSETYPNVPGFTSFLPLMDGTVLMYDKAAGKIARDGADVVVALYKALAVERSKPAPTPPPPPVDPQQARDALLGRALKALLQEAAA